VGRYAETFKTRVVGRLLPPESAAVDEVSREVGVAAQTLERWTAPARLEAVIATAAMDEAARSAWCREHGVYPQQLQQWREHATQALAEPEEARASPQQTKQDRRRIRELEREVRRKDRALAETAALLVLSRKLEAVFNNKDKGEAE
jgi:transposase